MESSNVHMTIAFNNENESQHCYETNGANVTVQVLNPRSNTHGSSKVKLKNIIGYKWENKVYPGHLIAVHKEGKIIAYSINVNGQGMIRLIHFGLGNKRALIKGATKEVLDLQFADSSKEIYIASIEESALHVHRLDVGEAGNLTCTQMLKIENPLPDHTPTLDKVSWCPYVPESDVNESVDEFSVMLLVWVRGNKFECYSCKTILETYGPGVLRAENIQEGLVKSYDEDRALITHAKFSPDGTTLAISTSDGLIRFYQIYFHETTPQCLHSWSPHDGASISSFFFLDNLTQPIAGNSLWKYAVTLAANNTEIKISKCDSWKTLQTIHFKSPIGQQLNFKAEIDRTSSYLVLSDQENRQMYVLQVLKENQLGQNVNGNENGHVMDTGGMSRVFVKSIAEFNLVSPILSYGISNASIRRYKCALSDNYLIDELEDYDEENNSPFCVVLRLFMIFPESVQECHILYQPAIGDSVEIVNAETEVPKLPEIPPLLTPAQKPSHQINLLTPEAFSSPVEKPKDVAPEVLSTIFMLAKTNPVTTGASNSVSNKSHDNVLNLTNCSLIEEEKKFSQSTVIDSTLQTQGKSAAASGGSSPSREVRDILLKADSVNEDYYPGGESDEEEEEVQNKNVLNALKSLDVDFKNIDDDDDDDVEEDEDDGNEEEDDDDAKLAQEKNSNPKWPQAPQFLDPNSAPATSKQVEILSNRMNQMIEIMETQSRYIAELRHEMFTMKSQCVADTIVTQKNLGVVEANIKKTIEHKIENSTTQLEKKQRESQDNTIQVFKQLSSAQTTSIDIAVRESLLKYCTHKNFVEGVGNAILSGIQKILEQSFKNAFKEILLPSYEKITQEMFQEMGHSFASGTKEYTRAFDNYMKQYGAVQFQMNEFSGAIREIPNMIDQASRSCIIPAIHNQNLEVRRSVDLLSTKVLQDVKELVKTEIQNGFERQAVNLEESVLSVVQRSHAETPAPTIYDQQEHIKQLLVHGEINKAFHQALISSDLSLLEFTLEKADVSKVFEPCPLDQSVLLSLIQQLTADMRKFSETKVRYLSNGVISLNMNDPITKEHAPKILRELHNTIQTFLLANPGSAFDTSLRMVLFACQSQVSVSHSM